MGQKGHIMVQKGLKMHKKRQKIEFLDLKRRFFSLAELGGTPSPLTENHCAQKSLAEWGAEKILLVVLKAFPSPTQFDMTTTGTALKLSSRVKYNKNNGRLNLRMRKYIFIL